MENNPLKTLFVLFFCISSVLMFRPVFLSSSLLFYIYYAFFFLTIVFIAVKFSAFITSAYFFPLILILASIIISAFSAWFFWSQSLIDSFMALPLYMGYILFFLLIYWKIGTASVEKVIITLGIVYMIVYYITFLMYPNPVFGNIEGFSTDRGFQRVMLEGRGFLFFLSFYALGRFFRDREVLWLIIFFGTVISVLMLLTRTLIAGSLIFWTLYIIRKSNYINKVIAVFFIAGFVFLVSQMNFSKILFKETVTQTQNLSDYVRIKAADFYLSDFSPNIYARIFGNGEPFKDTNYSRYVTYLEKGLGLYTSDIGYIGLYTKFGLLAVIAYIILITRTVKIGVPDDYLYCKYFLYFVFVISIIIDAPFSNSFITSVVLALYVLSSQEITFETEKVSPQRAVS